MPTKQRTSALGRLPKLLRNPPKRGRSKRENQAVFDALLDHYGLTDVFASLASEQDVARQLELSIDLWSKLTIKLLNDFIPAYRLSAIGRPKTFGKPEITDWISAGGGPFACPSDMTSFYQAQFVEVVTKLEQAKSKSRAWVFLWLANETEKVGPQQAEARRAMLPRPYRKRGTSRSLRQAFNAIPRSVRSSPMDHLPRPTPPGKGLF